MAPEPRIPTPEGLNLEFYEHAKDGVLHLQRCTDCGRFRHPPRYYCPECSSSNYEWQPSPGRGELFSWTVTHFPFDRGWAAELPYTTAVVELEERVRLVGALAGPGTDQLRLGLPLVAQIDPTTYGFPFITFVSREPT
jgi:uncharacterized OB-fold protein